MCLWVYNIFLVKQYRKTFRKQHFCERATSQWCHVDASSGFYVKVKETNNRNKTKIMNLDKKQPHCKGHITKARQEKTYN